MADSFPPPPSDPSGAPGAPTAPAGPPAAASGAALPPPVAPGADTSGDGAPAANGSTSSGGVNKTPFIVGGVVLALMMIVGVVVALVGDASSDESYSLEAALDNAGQVSSVRYDTVLMVDDESAFTIEGAVDGDVMSLRVDVGALLGGDLAGSTAEVIVDTGEGVLYIEADELVPSSPLDLLIPDLGWIAIDIGELDVDGGEDGLGIEDLLSGNPLIVIDSVEVDPSEATDLGAETIDGVETRHYQFTVDVAASVEIPVEIGELADRFGLDLAIPDGALGEVTYDVWVTEDNRIRRVALAFEIGGTSISVLLDVVSSGDAVEIEVPSEDEIFDLGEMFDFGAILDLGELLDS